MIPWHQRFHCCTDHFLLFASAAFHPPASLQHLFISILSCFLQPFHFVNSAPLCPPLMRSLPTFSREKAGCHRATRPTVSASAEDETPPTLGGKNAPARRTALKVNQLNKFAKKSPILEKKLVMASQKPDPPDDELSPFRALATLSRAPVSPSKLTFSRERTNCNSCST